MIADRTTRRVVPVVTFLLVLLLGVIAVPGVSQPGETTRGEAERLAAIRLNREGIKHLDAKRYRQAVDAFLKAFEQMPDDATMRRNLATAFVHLGVEHMNRGRFADAERALGQAVGLDPERPRIDYYRGVLDFKRGQYRVAVRRLEQVVKKAPDEADAWETLGHACYRLDRLEETVKAWKRALALKPDGKDALRRYLARTLKEMSFANVSVAGRSRHFRVKADSSRPGLERVAADVLQTLEDGRARVGGDLGFYPSEVVTVVLYTKRDFQRVTGMHHWVGGTFDGARIRVAVRDYDAHRAVVRRMLVHEFTHLVVLRLAAGSRVPAWINEGFARVEEGITRGEADRVLRELGGVGALYPLDRLERPFSRFRAANDARRAYAQACSFTHYLVGIGTKRGVGRFLRLLRDPPPDGVPAAFKKAFGLTLEEAFRRWKATLTG